MRKGILVDVKPLILLLVGKYDKEHRSRYIERFHYKQEDHEILSSFVSKFRCIVITPHTLAEFSNLIGTHIKQIIYLRKLLNGV